MRAHLLQRESLSMRKKRKLTKYERLLGRDCDGGGGPRVAKGYVPVLAGIGEETERFVVRVELFKHPLFMVLLQTAAEEFGYDHRGVVRIPCASEEFRRVLEIIS